MKDSHLNNLDVETIFNNLIHGELVIIKKKFYTYIGAVSDNIIKVHVVKNDKGEYKTFDGTVKVSRFH